MDYALISMEPISVAVIQDTLETESPALVSKLIMMYELKRVQM